MYKKTWWLNPICLYALLLILVFASYNMDSTKYAAMYSTEKGVDLSILLLHILCFVFFVVGVALSRKYKIKQFVSIENTYEFNNISIGSLYRGYQIIYFICIAAYIIWYGNFIRINGLSILKSFTSFSNLSSAMYVMRNNAGHISGITTFSELGIIAMPLAVLLKYLISDKKLNKKLNRQIILLVALSIFRAFAFSERLAVIEIIVPVVAVFLSMTENKKIKKIIGIAPIFAVIVLLVVFGLFEYSRSWLTYYQHYFDSYPEYIIQRLFGYYCNAINTEALCLKYIDIPSIPYYSIRWVWQLPGFDSVYSAISDVDIPTLFSTVLHTHGNAEYNNPGGMLTFVRDFGIFFPIFEILFGYIVGRAYRLFLRDNIFGLILYSFVFVCMLELPRYFMLGSLRGFIVSIGILILLVTVKRNSKEKLEKFIS